MTKYEVGDIITADHPMVHVLNSDRKSSFCDYCLTSNSNVKKCATCKHMHYCDKLCQKKDWKWHKQECQIYSEFYDILKRNIDRFILRLMLYLRKNSEEARKRRSLMSDPSQGRSFEDLMEHQDDVENDLLRMKTFSDLCSRFDRCDIKYEKQMLFSYFCKICINSYSILNTDLNEIATGLYIAESQFDHSCRPNAAPVFNGSYLEVRAIKPINVDEKITMNYVDLKETKAVRQDMLQKQYYFTCQCDRCTSDFDQGIDHEQLKEKIAEMDNNISDEQNWSRAYQIGLGTLEMLEKIYEFVHPDLTLQLVRILKLRVLICGDLDNEAIQLASRTDRAIKLTHGCNHDLYKLYREMLNLDVA